MSRPSMVVAKSRCFLCVLWQDLTFLKDSTDFSFKKKPRLVIPNNFSSKNIINSIVSSFYRQLRQNDLSSLNQIQKEKYILFLYNR